MQHLGKILPIDGYKVQIQGALPIDYLASLTHLYQPLLGIEAVSLYHLFMQEEMIRNLARDFAENVIQPRAIDIDKSGTFPVDIFDQMGELGLMGIPDRKSVV